MDEWLTSHAALRALPAHQVQDERACHPSGSFPLTPALSLGERENRSPFCLGADRHKRPQQRWQTELRKSKSAPAKFCLRSSAVSG